jgi:hypothetical protein
LQDACGPRHNDNGMIVRVDYGADETYIGTGLNAYAPTPFSWPSTYFVNFGNFSYVDCGWTYMFRNQTWVNAQAGSSGDIQIPAP